MRAPTSTRGRERAISLVRGDELLGRYRVGRVLGEGGFGVVYAAEQLSTGQPVAIKLLQKRHFKDGGEGAEFLARFQREIALMAKLRHPNSIRLLDSGVTSQGAPFVVLEFLEGRELAEVLREAPMPPRVALRVVSQMLEALAEAHGQGIVHRDIKPSNVMLLGSACRPVVKVLDFGIAAIQEGFRAANYQQLTMAGQTRGTPSYMCPELLRGDPVTPQVDIYAVGLVLAECLTGEKTVSAPTAIETCIQQLRGDWSMPPALGGGPFGSVLQRATAFDPRARYGSADEFLAELEAIDLSAAAGETSLGAFSREASAPAPGLGSVVSAAAAEGASGETQELPIDLDRVPSTRHRPSQADGPWVHSEPRGSLIGLKLAIGTVVILIVAVIGIIVAST